ncbi:MAG TPA: PaaI family thioesterase [Acidimicrobiales bacterium]|nr:PaaI family thioesterase [Acidimicrobiales bacterium]
MTDEPIDHRVRELIDNEVTPRRAEMRRAADSVRSVTDRMFATLAPEDALADVTSLVSQAAAILARYPRKRPFEGFPEAANAGDPHAFFDHSPIAGRANPLAPPIEMEIDNQRVIGRVNYGAAYEGPPGSVHGGHIAAAFDEVLGMAQSLGGQPGMTGTLTIRYRKPTPLHTDLRIEASITEMEGRKTFTIGTMYAGDLVTAEAEAVFIRVDMARIAELMAKRSRSGE